MNKYDVKQGMAKPLLKEQRREFILAAKIGVVRQLYNDGFLTSEQYKFLLIKYDQTHCNISAFMIK